MRIREATARDRDAIHAVHTAAFPPEEAADVAGLATALLSESSIPATLSLLAEDGGAVAGHVALSPIYRAQDNGLLGYILAPVGVVPQYQSSGVGSQLIRSGLAQLRGRGGPLVFVYGDPGYYRRFGFDADRAARFVAPYPLAHPFGWQALALGNMPAGTDQIGLRCVEALSDPALW